MYGRYAPHVSCVNLKQPAPLDVRETGTNTEAKNRPNAHGSQTEQNAPQGSTRRRNGTTPAADVLGMGTADLMRAMERPSRVGLISLLIAVEVVIAGFAFSTLRGSGFSSTGGFHNVDYTAAPIAPI